MSDRAKRIWLVYALALAATTAGATWMLFAYAPVPHDTSLGAKVPIHKMFYVHLPFAINAFLAAMLAFVGGIGYIWRREPKWDDFSAAAAGVAAMMCSVVLITGMIWAKKAWGAWWVWTPKLTFSLLLWLLYVVYLILRPSIESRQRRAMVCAVYAIAAFLDVPLVYLSSTLMPKDQHPSSITLAAPEMKITLAAWFLPVTLLMIGLVVALARRAKTCRTRAEAAAAEAAWDLPEESPGS